MNCPEGLETIGPKAFAGCTVLAYIYIPATVTEIADDAFEGCGSITIWGAAGSKAEEYALRKGFGFQRVS